MTQEQYKDDGRYGRNGMDNLVPYDIVRRGIEREAGVPGDLLRDKTYEQLNFLHALNTAANYDAVRKLAQHTDLMYTDPKVNDLLVTVTAWWIDQQCDGTQPKDVQHLLTIDKDRLQKRFEEIAARVGDDMWDQYRADLKNLQVPDVPVKTP